MTPETGSQYGNGETTSVSSTNPSKQTRTFLNSDGVPEPSSRLLAPHVCLTC